MVPVTSNGVPETDTFCVIAGGGPVGLLTAIELGRQGVSCIVLNDQRDTPKHPKSNAIGARTMEHFRRAGVASAVRASGLPANHPTDVTYVTRLDGREIGRLEMPSKDEAVSLARSGKGEWEGPEPPHRLSQIYLEKVLLDHAKRLPSVDVRFGHQVTDFVDHDDHVTTSVTTIDTGESYRLNSEYLVAADGGRSIVRKKLEIPFEGESGVVRPMMGGSMHSIYFRIEGGADRFNVDKAWQYWVLNEEIRALILAIDGKDHFCMHVKIPEDQSADDLNEYELLCTAAGFPGDFQIISSVPWRAGYCLLARNMQKGRAFLAGDAAHLFTPTGGLGMNTGVEDAVNLSWKLAAVANGWAGSRLLETYEADRLPMAHRSLQFSRAFANSIGYMDIGHLIEEDSPAGEAERQRLRYNVIDHARHEFIIPGIVFGLNYAHSRLIVPDGTPEPDDNAGDYQPCARPGARLPHLWLDDGTSLFDHLGVGFTLLALGPEPPEFGELVEEASQQKIPLDVFELSHEPAFEYLLAKLVLVGPDGHVFWRGDQLPTDVHQLVSAVRGESL